MSNDVKALISHYARLGFSRHIQTVCDEVIKKRGRDGTLVFWHAFSSMMEGVSRVGGDLPGPLRRLRSPPRPCGTIPPCSCHLRVLRRRDPSVARAAAACTLAQSVTVGGGF